MRFGFAWVGSIGLNVGACSGAQLQQRESFMRDVAVLPILLLAVLAVCGTGCSHVAPYERGKLAHPMMTADDLEGPAASHVLAVHEGATGGGSLSESGCGCN
jgi:hypothetical protein